MMRGPQFRWTAEKLEMLRPLALANLTSTEIGKRVGCSNTAVKTRLRDLLTVEEREARMHALRIKPAAPPKPVRREGPQPTQEQIEREAREKVLEARRRSGSEAIHPGNLTTWGALWTGPVPEYPKHGVLP